MTWDSSIWAACGWVVLARAALEAFKHGMHALFPM